MTKLTSTLILASIALSTVCAVAQTEAEKAFAAIKNMPGTWEGNTPKGPVQVIFKVTGRGSSVMSEIVGQEDMISMFHMDGNRLLLTHYCAVGNQPRMAASVSPDGKTFTFTYVDATNLASPEAGHMQRMVLTLLDENHHTEDWTYMMPGDKPVHAHFELQRAKS